MRYDGEMIFMIAKGDAAHTDKKAVLAELAFVWDRQLGESVPAHRAFVLYLAMGASRRVSDLFEVVSHMPHTIRKWSSTYQWRMRAEKYDEYKAIMLQKELDDEVLAMKVRHMRMGDELQKRGISVIKATEVEGTQVRDGLSMIRTGHDIELNAVDQTESIDKQIIDADVKTTEELPPEIAKKIGDALVRETDEG
jgi:hypothetical protein